jgi:hypothetical protein
MEKKQSLFNISINYNELMNEIEAAEGVLTDDQIAALEITETQLQSKSIAYLEVIRGKEAIIMQIDEEIKRLTAMKKANNNIVSRLKDNLLMAVNSFGGFEVGLTKFGTRKSQSINVEDVNTLPNEFKTIKVTESANKKELKDAIKRGEAIEGVELVDNLSLKIN